MLVSFTFQVFFMSVCKVFLIQIYDISDPNPETESGLNPAKVNHPITRFVHQDNSLHTLNLQSQNIKSGR